LNYLLARYGVEIRTALVRRYGSQQDGVDDALQQAFLRFRTRSQTRAHSCSSWRATP